MYFSYKNALFSILANPPKNVSPEVEVGEVGAAAADSAAGTAGAAGLTLQPSLGLLNPLLLCNSGLPLLGRGDSGREYCFGETADRRKPKLKRQSLEM